MSESSEQHLVIRRELDAPAELVWRMWTESERFATWYGPSGASVPAATMDVRVGGRRLLCMEMTTPDGPMQMWFTGEYLEVVEHRRLVFTDSMADEEGRVMTPEQLGMPPGHPATTVVTVELEQAGDRTSLVLTHVGVPADSPGATGWAMALDKLTARLAEAQPAG